MEVFVALERARHQLRNIGSFDPKKLDPEDRAFLLSVERVYEETFEGEFLEFFGAIALIYNDAKKKGEDPAGAIVAWIQAEIKLLRIERRLPH